MKTITIYVMRHGEKEATGVDPWLTCLGIRQAGAGAHKHLAGKGFARSFCSLKTRTWQTVTEALTTIGMCGEGPGQCLHHTVCPELWYSSVLGDDDGETFKAAIRTFSSLSSKLGPQATVAQWLKYWEPAQRMKTVFAEWLLATARSLPNGVNVLAASHQMIAESAVLDPANTIVLGFADMVCYVIEVADDGSAQIISSEVLRAPAVE